jgi:hypothetical protein
MDVVPLQDLQPGSIGRQDDRATPVPGGTSQITAGEEPRELAAPSTAEPTRECTTTWAHVVRTASLIS